MKKNVALKVGFVLVNCVSSWLFFKSHKMFFVDIPDRYSNFFFLFTIVYCIIVFFLFFRKKLAALLIAGLFFLFITAGHEYTLHQQLKFQKEILRITDYIYRYKIDNNVYPQTLEEYDYFYPELRSNIDYYVCLPQYECAGYFSLSYWLFSNEAHHFYDAKLGRWETNQR